MTATVDVNVLLHASDADSPLHARAAAFIQRLAQGPQLLYVFWPTAVAYVRLATHRAIFANPLTLEEALGNIEQLVTRLHVQSPGEQPGFWRGLRAVVTDARATGNLVSDAHLVALMHENGVRIVWTHGRDFRRFDGIDVRDPFN